MEALLIPPSLWDRFRHERRRYLVFVQAALCEKARKDCIIYHGNAGQLLLQGISHVLCIRLIASMSFRIQNIMEQRQMSRDEANRFIQNADRQRRDWTRSLYGKDWLDPNLYDLTINLKNMSVDGAANVVAAAARHEEFQPTEESLQAMANLLVASRVRAALVADEKTTSVDVGVKVEDGVVQLKGNVRPGSMVESITRVIGEVEGVRRVDRQGLDEPDSHS